MNVHTQPAASVAHQPPMVAAAVCPQPAADGGVAANPFADLPAWARTDEARALLAKIIADRPERSKVLAVTGSGATASLGYRGKAANQLRQLYDPFFMERIDWCQRAGWGSADYHKRRSAVLAYHDEHGPDALVARLLGEVAQ